jgi:sulfate permease, SulP family
MAVILVYLVGAFSHLPRATLAALVVASVTSLFNVKELMRLARVSPSGIAVALVSIAGVLYLGILQGVLLAALLSLAVILRDEATLTVSQLGAVANSLHYADLSRHPNAVCQSHTLVLRINGPLFYFNVETVELRILEYVDKAPPGLRRVVMDVSFTRELDISGGDMLHRLEAELSARGIKLWLADVHYVMRLSLLRQGLGDTLVDSTRRLMVSETLEALEHQAPVAGPC